METKKNIRKQVNAARGTYTDQQIKDWSREITRRVTALPAFKKAQRVLAYVDFNHEVMTRFLIEEAWSAGKEVAVPKVAGKDMVFYRLDDFSKLKPGTYGILEPAAGEIVQWEDALMIMPGVAFDKETHRIGYGGGYYDRFLEKNPSVERVAVAFAFQILPAVPWESTDICPQLIVTEAETYCRREEI